MVLLYTSLFFFLFFFHDRIINSKWACKVEWSHFANSNLIFPSSHHVFHTSLASVLKPNVFCNSHLFLFHWTKVVSVAMVILIIFQVSRNSPFKALARKMLNCNTLIVPFCCRRFICCVCTTNWHPVWIPLAYVTVADSSSCHISPSWRSFSGQMVSRRCPSLCVVYPAKLGSGRRK